VSNKKKIYGQRIWVGDKKNKLYTIKTEDYWSIYVFFFFFHCEQENRLHYRESATAALGTTTTSRTHEKACHWRNERKSNRELHERKTEKDQERKWNHGFRWHMRVFTMLVRFVAYANIGDKEITIPTN
jgi:hypothetical protein